VPFDFNINTRLLSRTSVILPSPRSGVIAPGQKESVRLRVCPGVPERLLETLLIELAHFDPITLQVSPLPAPALALLPSQALGAHYHP
jgi:hydrocephalus-inducing protein